MYIEIFIKIIHTFSCALLQITYNFVLFFFSCVAMYLVNYDVENWRLLIKSFRALPEVTKTQLLFDSYQIHDARLLEGRILWSIFEKLEAESGEMLWTDAIVILTTIRDRFWDSDILKVIFESIIYTYTHTPRYIARVHLINIRTPYNNRPSSLIAALNISTFCQKSLPSKYSVSHYIDRFFKPS